MNRKDFKTFCATHGLSIADAGRDWRDAGVNGAYVCAVISDDQEFTAIKSLLDRGEAYLASTERKNGQDWFEHRATGYRRIYADAAGEAAQEMAEEYARFLESQDDITWYDSDDIARRNKALSDNPAAKNESQDEHFDRVAEMQVDGWLTPLYVNEPGHWDCSSESLLLSDSEKKFGIWSYDYDNWSQHVILVLDESEEDQENDACGI